MKLKKKNNEIKKNKEIKKEQKGKKIMNNKRRKKCRKINRKENEETH